MKGKDEQLHRLARAGALNEIKGLLRANPRIDLSAYDSVGRTALMEAVRSAKASPELVRLLASHGADANQISRNDYEKKMNSAAFALKAGDPDKLEVVLEFGARVDYRRPDDYDALMDAACATETGRLLETLRILLARGIELGGVSRYGESALRMFSNLARFDAVRLLLEAGADEAHLRWTPLIRAVALDSLARVESLLRRGAALEETDYWGRTAWLVAVATGDVSKARLLKEHGVNTSARGRLDEPACFYAIANRHTAMLEWLIGEGLGAVDEVDQFGTTALIVAVRGNHLEAVPLLLKSGVNLEAQLHGQTALHEADTREMVTVLLDAGSNPAHLSSEGRRALLGFEPEETEDRLASLTVLEFETGWERRFGRSNPEEMHVPFWRAMVEAGVSAYSGGQYFGGGRSPVWCAQRFGQSLTRLPDGRVVQIAGEHEDHYDQDFCIYNDVFVHYPDGDFRIFGYPEAVFPPTDFHTATLMDDGCIYIIGSLGYQQSRQPGVTPVYALDTKSFAMRAVAASGEPPGWISQHRAERLDKREIAITDGDRRFVLDLERLVWRRK